MLKDLLGSRLRARLLGWLYSHPDEAFFGRQVAMHIHEDPKNVSRELGKLTDLGILTCETVGRQKHYQANADCPIFEELRGLAVKTLGLADVIREALEPLSKKITVAFLYGSQASGDFTAQSDVDLMVVGSTTFGEVSNVLDPPEERLAREINPAVFPVEEFADKIAAGDYFLTRVVEDPKVFLIGDEDELGRLAGRTEAETTSSDTPGDRRPDEDRGT